MISILKQLWRNRIYILKRSWQIAGSIYAVIGLAGMLANLDDLIAPELNTWKRVMLGIGLLFVIWMLSLIASCTVCSLTKEVCYIQVLNNHKVYLHYGDLFAKEIVCDHQGKSIYEKRNIVIPVNCCFDTIVDNDLISSTKIHGKAFLKLYDSGKFTQESLNQTIKDNLSSQKSAYISLTEEQKRKGNLERYPFGTVAEIAANEEQMFFLLALTEFDQTLHAQIYNRGNYLIVLQRLIEYICARSQGLPTVLPIVGGGLPEVSLDEQTILELMLKVIKLNVDKINCDIHIVIRTTGKEAIRILGLR